MSASKYDVAIVGGGLAGLSLAIQLSRRMPSLSVLVVESNPHPVPEAAHKVGESLVELGTYYFCKVLGLKKHLDEEQLPKLGLRFFFHTDEEKAQGDRFLEECVELGANQFPPSPSYQIDRGIFENYLAEKCKELGVAFLDNVKACGIEVSSSDDSHLVEIEHKETNTREIIEAKWVVDACSRASILKRKLGLKKESTHKVSSAWFRIEEKLDISDWSDSDAWIGDHRGDNSRWFSTNHLMGKGYWVWIIPLSSGSTSIGIVADNKIHPLNSYNSIDKAMAWLQKYEPQCAENISPYLDRLQDFLFLQNFSHGCKQVFSDERWFLTGEAGIFLDPFYSPGSDLIAISNTFVTNIIEADNGGDNVSGMVAILNTFYQNICESTDRIYQDKYEIFGNALVMSAKITWDYSVYWSFTASLFMQGVFFDFKQLFALRQQFEYLGQLNKEMQDFFREWNRKPQAHCESVYMDQFQIPFLRELNAGLYDQLSDDEFARKFSQNIEELKLLARDIVDHAASRHDDLGVIRAQMTSLEDLPQNSGSEESSVAALLNRIQPTRSPQLPESASGAAS